MRAKVEMLVEPFVEGTLGSHVTAAIDAFEDAGLEIEIGPFGTSATGDLEAVIGAVESAMRKASEAGATRFATTVTVMP